MQHLYAFKEDNEWYTTKEDVKYFLDRANIPKNKIIWCPFDKENSNFVTVLREYGYKVLYSHIDDEKDFFNYSPAENWDIILSNPPFKNKAGILKRLLEFKNKSWGLIFGIHCFNVASFCQTLKEFEKINIILLGNRMRFTKDSENYNINKLSYPSFNTFWICNNIFDENLLFWDGVSYKK